MISCACVIVYRCGPVTEISCQCMCTCTCVHICVQIYVAMHAPVIDMYTCTCVHISVYVAMHAPVIETGYQCVFVSVSKTALRPLYVCVLSLHFAEDRCFISKCCLDFGP